MARRRARRLLTLALSGCLVIVGTVSLIHEVRPFALSGATPEERFAVLADAVSASGLSHSGRRSIMQMCLYFGDSLYVRAQPSFRRMQMVDGCGVAASQFVAAMPSFSEAWLVKAKVAAEHDDVAGVIAAITASRRSAPHVLWLAGERLRLRETLRRLPQYAGDLADLDAGQGADILTLLANGEGSLLLAERYAAQPDFRERLTKVAETAPPDQQRVLLNQIRAASQK